MAVDHPKPGPEMGGVGVDKQVASGFPALSGGLKPFHRPRREPHGVEPAPLGGPVARRSPLGQKMVFVVAPEEHSFQPPEPLDHAFVVRTAVQVVAQEDPSVAGEGPAEVENLLQLVRAAVDVAHGQVAALQGQPPRPQARSSRATFLSRALRALARWRLFRADNLWLAFQKT